MSSTTQQCSGSPDGGCVENIIVTGTRGSNWDSNYFLTNARGFAYALGGYGTGNMLRASGFGAIGKGVLAATPPGVVSSSMRVMTGAR